MFLRQLGWRMGKESKGVLECTDGWRCIWRGREKGEMLVCECLKGA